MTAPPKVKDFIETEEGLVFAVVSAGWEGNKALCFLRYLKQAHGWQKLASAQANAFLKQNHPQYLYYSPVLDAWLHAVPSEQIYIHHQPRQRLQQLLHTKNHDPIESDAHHLCDLLQRHGIDMAQFGVTGSLLIGAQGQRSDIDLVCYQKPMFHQCRQTIQTLIAQSHLRDLSDSDWQEAYQRRDCTLSFEDYVWHERRKYNKAIINARKFDIGLVAEKTPQATTYQKLGHTTLSCQVTDDGQAFDYPAEFAVAHPEITSIVSFSATYVGQAQRGETIEVSGLLEQNQNGVKRLVVGSSREAPGEYIKVIHA